MDTDQKEELRRRRLAALEARQMEPQPQQSIPHVEEQLVNNLRPTASQVARYHWRNYANRNASVNTGKRKVKNSTVAKYELGRNLRGCIGDEPEGEGIRKRRKSRKVKTKFKTFRRKSKTRRVRRAKRHSRYAK